MKYFTPELIVMGQNADARILDEQERLWDEAGDRYVATLEKIRPLFPPGLRRLDENYYLHDAMIVGMGQRDGSFLVHLQLDTPPYSLLSLAYDLVGPAVIVREALPAEMRTPDYHVEWQYDEIDSVPGDPPTWRQSILLSNGWEIKLHFREVQVQESQALLPSSHGEPKAIPQSA